MAVLRLAGLELRGVGSGRLHARGQLLRRAELASVVGTRLLAESARDGAMAQPALVEALELMHRPGMPPLSVFALWLAARSGAGVDAEAAGRWLAHAERTLRALDTQIWPESVLRVETVAVLGLSDLDALLDRTPPLKHAAALAEALAWARSRDPGQTSPCEAVAVLLAPAAG